MKKYSLLVLSLLLVFLMIGCQKLPNDTPDTPPSDTFSQPDTQKQPNDDNEAQIIPDSYKQILDNKKTFILDGEEISIDEYKFPYMMNYFSDCKGVEYAAIDMDGDGKVELLTQESLGDILILHEENGVVYGYDFIFRNMYYVKDDGSFSWNANSGNTYGVSKIRFENQTCQETEVYRVEFDENNNSFKYFIYGTEVSKEDFESNSANLESNVKLTWYKLDSYSNTTDN